MNKVLDIVTSKGLTYEQKVVALAHAAENSLEVLEIPEKTRHYMETGAICDLDEGHAPYRPRYIMHSTSFFFNGAYVSFCFGIITL